MGYFRVSTVGAWHHKGKPYANAYLFCASFRVFYVDDLYGGLQ